MKTGDILIVAAIGLAAIAVISFVKNAIPGAVNSVNNGPLGELASGVMGVVHTTQDLGTGVGEALDGLSNVGD